MSDAKPVCAALVPYALELAAGTYFWCACGQSKKQPWCDGSHKDSGIEPVKFNVKKGGKTVWLCACKATKNAPLCDGAHNKLTPAKGWKALS